MRAVWVIECKQGKAWHAVDTYYSHTTAWLHYKDYCSYVGAKNICMKKYVPEKRKGKK